MRESLREFLWSKAAIQVICAGCALKLWVFWILSHSHSVGAVSSICNPMAFSALVGLAAVALGSRVSPDRKTARMVDMGFAVLSAAAAACVVVLDENLGTYWVAPSAVLGLGLGWYHLRLALRLLSLELFRVMALVLLYSMGYGVLNWFASLSTDAGGLVAGVLLPIVVAVFVGSLGDEPVLAGPNYYADSSREFILGPLACTCGVYFVYSATNVLLKMEFGSFAAGDASNPFVSSLGHVTALAAFVAAYNLFVVKRSTVGFYTIIKVPVFLLTCALVLAGTLGSSPVLQAFTFPTVWITSAVLAVLTTDIAQHGDLPPVRCIGICMVLGNLAYCAGRYLFYLFAGFDPSGASATPFLSQTICLILLGTLVAVVLLTFKVHGSMPGLVFYAINNAAGTASRVDTDAFDEVCSSVSREYGLSHREADILALIARGYSKPYIAERLSISDNTVRTHSKHIYEKVGIHSRVELQEMVEERLANR